MGKFYESVKITTASGKEYFKEFNVNDSDRETLDDLITNEFFNKKGYITIGADDADIIYLKRDRIESVTVIENKHEKYNENNESFGYDFMDF